MFMFNDDQGKVRTMKISKMRLLATTAPLAAILLSTPSYAQEETSTDAGIEEIIVTAQRREENLQDVPISVSAFTAEQLAQRGTTDLSRLEGQVPGFTFGRSGSDARPAMRGVRTENVGVNGDTTIGFFVDGVYQSRASQATGSFVDIERVEIQRGPQGTLYGRNTFGGNISITSAQPSLEGYFGQADVTVGENGRFRGDLIVNAALSDVVAFRFAGSYEKSDGYVKNVNPLGNNLFDDDNRYVRGSVLFKPSDAFSAVLKYDYARRVGAGGSAFGYKLAGTYYDIATRQQFYNATPVFGLNTRSGNRDGVNDALPGSAVATSDLGVPIFAPGNPYVIDTDQKTELDLESQGFSANLAYDFGGVTLKSITGYTDFGAIRTSDTDFSGNAIGVDFQDTQAKTFSQEIQLLSSDSGSPLTWVLGGYYFKDKLKGIFINQQTPRIIRNVTPNLTLAQNGGGFYDQQRAETESYAGYAQASFAISEKLKATAGIRYTSDKKDFAFANANALLPLIPGTGINTGLFVANGNLITLRTGPIPASSFGVQGAPSICTFQNRVGNTDPAPVAGTQCRTDATNVVTGATYNTKKFNKTTWKLGLDYQVSDENLLYASVSTGFRSGGFNSGQGQAALTPTFDPETVTAFEIGSKNRFFDNRVQLNLAAFYNRYSALQEQRQIAQGATTLSIIENSGKSRAYGAEAELIWKPSRALQIGANIAYLNAKYTQYENVPTPNGGIPISILVPDILATAPTVVNGVTIAPIGSRRIFAPGYNCGLIPGTGGAGQPAANYGCDLSGKDIPYSPELTGAIFAGYDIDLGSAGTLTPFAIFNFSSSFFGQPYNSILEKQGAFSKIDLRLTWEFNDSISVQGFVTNVTNKTTATRFVWGGGGALQASYAAPRLWGAKASFKF